MKNHVIFVIYKPRLIDYYFYKEKDEIIVTNQLEKRGYKVLSYIPGNLVSDGDSDGFYLILDRELPDWFEINPDYFWKKSAKSTINITLE